MFTYRNAVLPFAYRLIVRNAAGAIVEVAESSRPLAIASCARYWVRRGRTFRIAVVR